MANAEHVYTAAPGAWQHRFRNQPDALVHVEANWVDFSGLRLYPLLVLTQPQRVLLENGVVLDVQPEGKLSPVWDSLCGDLRADQTASVAQSLVRQEVALIRSDQSSELTRFRHDNLDFVGYEPLPCVEGTENLPGIYYSEGVSVLAPPGSASYVLIVRTSRSLDQPHPKPDAKRFAVGVYEPPIQ